MRVVRNIVNTGRTIACTIHQPAIDIFEARCHPSLHTHSTPSLLPCAPAPAALGNYSICGSDAVHLLSVRQHERHCILEPPNTSGKRVTNVTTGFGS